MLRRLLSFSVKILFLAENLNPNENPVQVMAGSDDGTIKQNLESRLQEIMSGRLRQRNATLDWDGIDIETGH